MPCLRLVDMPRKPRRILPNRLYEFSLTTFQGRYFFIPSDRLNELVLGALTYAAHKYELAVCFVVFLSNHGHLQIRADCKEQVASFLCLAKSQIAQEVQKLCGWKGGIFERSEITEISEEPEAQIERLKYLMAHGVKEGLVRHPSDWPGIHSAKALLTGSMRMKGVWVKRSDLYEVNRTRRRQLKNKKRAQRRQVKQKDYEERLTLSLSPIPCWDGLDGKEIAKRSRELCREILAEHADKRDRVPKDYRKRLMDRSRYCHRPKRRKRTERPKFHAATYEEWKRCVREIDLWHERYKAASARLRSGVLEAIWEFPEHAFLPTGIFFRTENGLPPPQLTG